MSGGSPTEGASVGDKPEMNLNNSPNANKQTSYNEVAKRKFPNITVDLEVSGATANMRLTYNNIADIIYDRLRLKRGDFMSFRTFKEDVGKETLKIRTTWDVDVKKRYGRSPSFAVVDERRGIEWKGTIRGADSSVVPTVEETMKLRIINPPEEASFAEVRAEVEKVLEVRSGIREELVSGDEEPRLAGVPTGILSVRIKKVASRSSIPRYITIRRQKVKIHLALPPDVCLKCFLKGHRVATCPTVGGGEEEEEEEDGQEEEEAEHEREEEDVKEEDRKVHGDEAGGEKSKNEDNGLENDMVKKIGDKNSGKGPSILKPVRGGGGASGGTSRRGARQGLRSTS